MSQPRRSLRDLTPHEVALVTARSGGRRCYWCHAGEGARGVALTLEHLRPLSRGGEEHARNYALACETCNKRRGARRALELCRCGVRYDLATVHAEACPARPR